MSTWDSLSTRGAVVATCVSVAIVCVGGAIVWTATSRDSEPPPPADDYASAGVPWWDGRDVHWAGHTARRGNEGEGVSALTATEDAAVFLHDRLGYDDGTVPEPYLGTLTALFDDGRVTQIATQVVGVPLADPQGHVVAWTVEVDADTVEVVAYDTEERAELGSQRVELDEGGSIALTAVVRDTVYLSSGRQALAWHPRDGGGAPEEVPGAGRRLVVGGSDDGLLLAGRQLGAMVWQGGDGSLLRIGASFGRLSPDGRFVAAAADDDMHDTAIQAVPSGDRVEIDIPVDLQAYQTRWAGDGTLVVAAVSRAELKDGWDDAYEVINYACEVDGSDCRPLRGGPRVNGLLPGHDDTYLGQLLTAFETSGLS